MIETTYINGKPVAFDIEKLDEVNRIRTLTWGPGHELKSLNGYCWSTGCSCRHPVTKQKGVPHCSRFKSYDQDGVREDCINQLFGI